MAIVALVDTPNIFAVGVFTSAHVDQEVGSMGYFRTAILLAAMTALFMGIGYLVGGQMGMVVAFLVAAATNLFAYWRSDKMVLSMYGAREVDERAAPDFTGWCGSSRRMPGSRCPRSSSWTIRSRTRLPLGAIQSMQPSRSPLGCSSG